MKEGLLNLLDEIQLKDSKTLRLISNEDAVNNIRSIRKDYVLTHLFDALTRDERLLALLWSYRIQLTPFPGLELPLLYIESGQMSPSQPLEIESERGKSRLKVTALDAVGRFLPDILGFIGALEAHAAKANRVGESAQTGELIAEPQAISIISKLPLWDDAERDRLIAKLFRRAGDLVIPAAVDILSVLKIELVKVGREHSERLCRAMNLHQEQLVTLVRKLHTEHEVIHPSFSVAWCKACIKHPQTMILIGLQEPPVVHCPVCKSEMNVRTFFHFVPAIVRMMSMQDEIVHTSVLWTLSSGEGLSWLPGVYLEGITDDTEKDAVFRLDDAKGYVVVETKVYALDKPVRALKENIVKDALDFIEHCRAYERNGVPIDSVLLVTNAPSAITRQAMGELKSPAELSSLRGKLEVVTPEIYRSFHERFNPE